MITRPKGPISLLTRLRNPIGIAMVLIVAAIAFLFIAEYRRGERRLVESNFAAFSERLAGLEKAVEQIVTYLDLAHNWADGFWSGDTSMHLEEDYFKSITYHEDGDYFDWDPRGGESGSVSGVGRPVARGQEFTDDLALAVSLLPWFRAAKEESSAILHSYFLANSMVTSSYPALSAEMLIEVGGGELIRAFDMFYEPHGGQQTNPERAPYFLPPYRDRTGFGLMVTYSYPVYEKDRFVGVIATDITLGFLQEYTERLAGLSARLILVAQDNQVIADSVGAGADKLGSLGDRLPDSLREHQGQIGDGQVTGRIGAHYVNAQRLENAPWTFVQIIDRTAVSAVLLSSQITYAGGFLGVISLFFIAYFSIRRNRLARALDESQTKYREIFNSSGEAIIIHDAESAQLLEVNQAFETMTGYRLEEATHLTIPDISAKPREEATLEVAEHMARAAGGESHLFEWQLRRKDGGVLWAEVELRPARIDGESRVLSVLRDVDRRKKNEAELESYRETLEQLVEQRTQALSEAQDELVKREKLAVIGQLMATVSHELRNPLGTIENSLFVIGEHVSPKTEIAQKAIDRAHRNIERCGRIVDELLDYTRSRPMDLVDTHFDSWMTELLAEMGPPPTIEHNLQLEAEVVVPMDTERMRRCMINLLDNAHQAILSREDRGGLVSIHTETSGDRVRVRISDNGPGISDESLVRIFEPLFSTRVYGVGLGLPIARQIAEAHGGGLRLSNGSAGGTVAEIWLPITQ